MPVKFPLLLAQGVEGIAVGLSTKIMPHNFLELIKASIAILKDRPFKINPDFQTGGVADFTSYNHGKKGGKIRLRSNIEVLDKKTLVIRNVPYSVTTTGLIDSILKLDSLVDEISEASAKLIESFWPGPLTMLFKPNQTIPKNITTGLIGIRQPGNLITRKILAGLNYPLTAPSANISGEDPTTTAEQVKDSLGNKVDLILDGGICRGGEPSTLVDTTQTPVRLVRKGAIKFKSIQDSLNETPQV